jgi:hypothetical protein
MLRVLIAGVLGGLVLFAGGVVDHMIFGWSGRTLSRLEDQTAAREFLENQQLKPGWYAYPEMSEAFDGMTEEEQTVEWERVAELYKQGPAAYIIVPPAGEDMMSTRQLGLEALANFLSALLVAGILYVAGVSNLWTRWLIACWRASSLPPLSGREPKYRARLETRRDDLFLLRRSDGSDRSDKSDGSR